ncbi:hypothetical protein OG331_22705 [Streptomyces sp. NBC_01017]|nr:hypothetical protein OG331_22705 [Streptomyces sp. NBC_01017]
MANLVFKRDSTDQQSTARQDLVLAQCHRERHLQQDLADRLHQQHGPGLGDH